MSPIAFDRCRVETDLPSALFSEFEASLYALICFFCELKIFPNVVASRAPIAPTVLIVFSRTSLVAIIAPNLTFAMPMITRRSVPRSTCHGCRGVPSHPGQSVHYAICNNNEKAFTSAVLHFARSKEVQAAWVAGRKRAK